MRDFFMDKINEDFLLIQKINRGRLYKYRNHTEANEYGGCEFWLEGLRYIQRTAKVTPKKTGQFVTLWKRNSIGVTSPLDIKDNFYYVVIICFQNKKIGRFLFPKNILAQKKILSSSITEVEGKRGFRVYPNWDIPTSKQAIETQRWQLAYFSEDLVL